MATDLALDSYASTPCPTLLHVLLASHLGIYHPPTPIPRGFSVCPSPRSLARFSSFDCYLLPQHSASPLPALPLVTPSPPFPCSMGTAPKPAQHREGSACPLPAVLLYAVSFRGCSSQLTRECGSLPPRVASARTAQGRDEGCGSSSAFRAAHEGPQGA